MPKELFVFGSNISGIHGDGAAKRAFEDFGAEWGVGAGITGKCYAIPTMEGIDSLRKYVEQFITVAGLLPEYTFLLTKVGCGIAGHSEDEIRPLFADAPPNVIKPKGW